jgi:hypothetical protein
MRDDRIVDVANLPYQKGAVAETIFQIRRISVANPEMQTLSLYSTQYDALKVASGAAGILMFGRCLLRRAT